MSSIINRPSPNFGPRRPGAAIDMLVLHYTGMPSGAAALDRLCDPVAAVSSHYLIEEDGRIFRLVAEEHRAWHAGLSFWAGETDINSRSIGIELVNPGHEFGYRPFPGAQMASLAELARGLVARHSIPPARVLGHSDVAPERKQDPGELFDWPALAAAGIGDWPDFTGPAPAPADPAAALAAIGYGVARDIGPVVAAFQRHFRPTCVDGALDPETLRRIGRVAFDWAGVRGPGFHDPGFHDH